MVLSGNGGSGGQAWQPAHRILSFHDFELEGEPKELKCLKVEHPTLQGCSVTWENKMHIYGGSHSAKPRQILRLDGYVLQSIGNLNFDFVRGACTTVPSQMIVLCFSDENNKLCRRATGPLEEFKNLRDTHSPHSGAPISASKCELP